MQSKELVYQVRKNLWSRGYRVQDLSETELGFDLLVEGKHRVKVESSSMGAFDSSKYDFVAVVAIGEGAFTGRIAIRYRASDEWHEGPTEAFGLPASKENNGKKEDQSAEKGGAESDTKNGASAT